MRKFLENTYGADLTFIEGFDDCILGMEESTMRVTYSVTKCIDKILSFTGVETEEEAEQHFYEFLFGAKHDNMDIAPLFLRAPEHTSIAFWLN
jgi:hypothetical protein